MKLTYAERDTILAALRRWQSYPAAREADFIATAGGKHRPLDNAEIERICKRMTKIERKRYAALLLRRSNNGATLGKWNKGRVATGGAADEVARLKHASGKNVVDALSLPCATEIGSARPPLRRLAK
jgi:DNA-binding transcriptional regulator YiaG